MIIWVNANSVNMPVDQRVKIEKVCGQELIVTLLGTGEVTKVQVTDIKGLEIGENITIRFKVSGVQTRG